MASAMPRMAMPVEECSVPATSVLDHRVVASAYFLDAYRAPLMDGQSSVVDIFHAVFGHHPLWIKRILIARNHIATAYGLDAPAASEIMNPERKTIYKVGDTIGPWPIFSLTQDELVAGRDNKHLDFRLSVLRQGAGDAAHAVVSTVCTTHNAFGRVYLFFVIPFHKWGVKYLIARAIAAGRL
jgi:hypothetical protein